MDKKLTRKVFFISDGTGISVETIGNSLLTQFDIDNLETETIRYVNTEQQAANALDKIATSVAEHVNRPIVFFTIVAENVSCLLKKSQALTIDVFGAFLGKLERELGQEASFASGLSHSRAHSEEYNERIDALNYSLLYDDGEKTSGYGDADVILIGVSRSGKTPTSLYLALHYAVKAANNPITIDDIETIGLPEILYEYRHKLFGLTITPERLQLIRQKRRPDSQYASYKQCAYEISRVEQLYQKHNIPFLDSTQYSVEELATKILTSTEQKVK